LIPGFMFSPSTRISLSEKYAPYSEEELAVYRFDNWLINVFKP
jgi:hypothetical protein